MKNEIKNILKEAEQVVNRLENGKTYPADYIVGRFQSAADKYPNDQLIGGMRDVLTKVAQKREYIHQKEIATLYNKMYGFSGGQTGFRNALEDLLPEDHQFQKVAYKSSNLRTMEEVGVKPLYKDSELSNAFSVLFSLGGDSSFSTFKPQQDKSIQKAVISKLSSLGQTPEGVDIIHSNDHFALCSANYKTTLFNKVSALIPVQITDGVTKEPQHVILGGSAVSLDKESLYTAIREAEKDYKGNANKKFASERGDGSSEVKVEKLSMSNELKDLINLENTLIAAASNFDSKRVNLAISTLAAELAGFGIKNPEIKIATSNKSGIIFNVSIPTKLGRTQVTVPVEIHNNVATLPSRFAALNDSKEEVVYDFSRKGFERFASTLKSNSASINLARDNGPLRDMSYHQLIDQMVEGVANKDYKLAEDVLSTIDRKFGGNQYLVAFDQFTQLLKHSSTHSERDRLIKEAFDRGDLINVPTSVELYCPKLGLPVSKVSFDEKGRPVAAGRRSKAENQLQDTMISTGRILFT